MSSTTNPNHEQQQQQARDRLQRSLGSATSKEIIFKELSYAIVGAAIEVHRHMGPGQLEATYERALAKELAERAIAFRRQVSFPSFYKGEVVGEFVADLIVNDQIIVELKAVDRVHPSARAQLLGYLRATGLRLGLLINFNEAVLWHGIKRIVR